MFSEEDDDLVSITCDNWVAAVLLVLADNSSEISAIIKTPLYWTCENWKVCKQLMPIIDSDGFCYIFDRKGENAAFKQLVPQMSPLKILTDFESAAFTVIFVAFPNRTVQWLGCLFHFCLLIMENIQPNNFWWQKNFSDKEIFIGEKKILVQTASNRG